MFLMRNIYAERLKTFLAKINFEMACLNSTYSERLAHPLHYLLDGHYAIRSSDKLFRNHDFFLKKLLWDPRKVKFRHLWLRWS